MRSLPPQQFDRILKLHEKLTGSLLEEVRRLKQDLDHDQERMTAAIKPVVNHDELFNMVAFMTVDRETATRLKNDVPK